MTDGEALHEGEAAQTEAPEAPAASGDAGEADPGWYGPEVATFGDRLAAARRAAALSQEEFARRLGVELGTLREWEDDLAEPRANRLAMICGVLNVPITWLLTGEGPGPGAALAALRAGGGEASDIAEALMEIRTLRAQIMGAADRLGRLEKRLRARGGAE